MAYANIIFNTPDKPCLYSASEKFVLIPPDIPHIRTKRSAKSRFSSGWPCAVPVKGHIFFSPIYCMAPLLGPRGCLSESSPDLFDLFPVRIL